MDAKNMLRVMHWCRGQNQDINAGGLKALGQILMYPRHQCLTFVVHSIFPYAVLGVRI